MKLNILIFIFSVFFCSVISAQNVPFDKALFKERKEEYKAAKEALDEGHKKFEKGRYDEAIELFLKANKFNPNNADLNFKIGRSYIASYQKDRKGAVPYYEKAYQLDPNVDKKIHLYLGEAYHLNGLWDKAIESFQIEKSGIGKGAENEVVYLDKEIYECKNGKELQKNPIRVFVDNLGEGVNTAAPEYCPVITTDESLVYFTSRRSDTYGETRDAADGEFNEDIYVSTKQNGKWTKSKNVGTPVNSDNHDATVGLSPDGKTMYIYKGSNGGDLYECDYQAGVWTKPEALNKNINTEHRETSGSLSFDGKTLYFVSNRLDLTLGGMDIFTSKKDEKGKWGKPVNLGSTINTIYDEESVFAHPDGKTLYFSSQGHKTMGGFDVFKSVYENGKWGEPQNLGYPVNTPADEISFVVNANGKRAYYSTTQEGGFGHRDIYVITMLGPEKPMILNTEDLLVSNVTQPVSDLVIEPKIPVSTNELTLFKGRILDSITKKPLESNILMVDNAVNQEIGTFTSDKITGKFLVTLPSGKNYNITVKAEGYLFQSVNFDIPPGGDYQVIEKDILLNKVSVGMVIVLNNIFFDNDKFSLRKESETELENLHKLLTENPTLKIEISGHTDNRGSAEHNQKLSENRAHAVVNYLVTKGIQVSRLEFKGYGLTKPVASNLTEVGRQMNRRTEFKVLSK
ncbi:MAG: PD40 domain-containing protein [Opitutaceae bacterium]|nr:PD40 domain-containing protein [Cytophagales bacterium]